MVVVVARRVSECDDGPVLGPHNEPQSTLTFVLFRGLGERTLELPLNRGVQSKAHFLSAREVLVIASFDPSVGLVGPEVSYKLAGERPVWVDSNLVRRHGDAGQAKLPYLARLLRFDPLGHAAIAAGGTLLVLLRELRLDLGDITRLRVQEDSGKRFGSRLRLLDLIWRGDYLTGVETRREA